MIFPNSCTIKFYFKIIKTKTTIDSGYNFFYWFCSTFLFENFWHKNSTCAEITSLQFDCINHILSLIDFTFASNFKMMKIDQLFWINSKFCTIFARLPQIEIRAIIKIVCNCTHLTYFRWKLVKSLPVAKWLIHFEWNAFSSLDKLGRTEGIFFNSFRNANHTHHHFHFISFHLSFPHLFLFRGSDCLAGCIFSPSQTLSLFFFIFFSRSIRFCMPATRVCGHLNKFISIFIQYEFFSIILYKIMYEWMSECKNERKVESERKNNRKIEIRKIESREKNIMKYYFVFTTDGASAGGGDGGTVRKWDAMEAERAARIKFMNYKVYIDDSNFLL